MFGVIAMRLTRHWLSPIKIAEGQLNHGYEYSKFPPT